MPETLARVILGRFRLAVYRTSYGRLWTLYIGKRELTTAMHHLPRP